MSRRGMLLFGALAVIWGMPYLLIKISVAEVDPVALVFVRTVIAASVLLPFALRRRALRVAVQRWPIVLVYAAVEIAAPWLLLSDAQQYVSSSLSGLVIAAVPLMGATLAWLLDKERLDRWRLLGLLVGLAGVGSLLGLDLAAGVDLRAVVELLVTALCWAVGPVIISRYLNGVAAVGVNTVALGVTAVAILPFALPQLPRELPSPTVIVSVLLLALVCTGLGFLALFALIGEVGAARATVFTYVNPAVALLLGVTVLDEPLTTGILVGFPLVLLGSVLAARQARATPTPATSPAPSPSERQSLNS